MGPWTRETVHPGPKGWTKTPGIVSDKEFNSEAFGSNKRVNGKLEISVGKNGEDSPYMTGIDEKPLPDIKFKGFSGWELPLFLTRKSNCVVPIFTNHIGLYTL